MSGQVEQQPDIDALKQRYYASGNIYELLSVIRAQQATIKELKEYARHDEGCSASMDTPEHQYRCKCGWRAMLRAFEKQTEMDD